MSELSYFFNGTTTGDASLAPYSHSEIAGLLADAFGVDFVIPYLDNLSVESTGTNNHSVVLGAGAAFVKGTYFESTTPVTITIGATVANPRYDRVVLRYDSAAQTIRPYVIEGAEAAVPSLPALTGNDMPLFFIYCPSPFGVGSTVDNANIHDQRVFNVPGAINSLYNTKNAMPNSEFMAYSDAAGGTTPPDFWRTSGAPNTVQGTAAFADMMRGWAVECDLNVGDTLETTITLPYGSTDESNWVTVRGLLDITSGGLTISAITRQVAGTTTVAETDNYLLGEQEFILRFPVDPENDISLDIVFEALAGGAVFTLGQIMVARGFVTGPFRKKRELIMFDQALTDANWTATAKSDGTTTISLNADFSANVLPDTNGIILRLRGNDSGSAAAAIAYLAAYNRLSAYARSGAVFVAGTTNDIPRDQLGITALTRDANEQFSLKVEASGAGTFDATVHIVGVSV